MEGDDSSFVDDRVTMDFLWEAAVQMNSDLKWLTTSYSFSTVSGTYAYNMPSNFQELYATDSFNRFFITYADGSTTNFLYSRPYDKVYLDRLNQSGTASQMYYFSLTDATPLSTISSTATSAGTATNGESTLTDSAAPFTNVSVGDVVHNLTDQSSGIVAALSTTSAVITSLWGGTNNDWTNGDSYIITPQTRYSIVLDPTPDDTYTVTVQYVSLPTPVYSYYRYYPFPSIYKSALVKYAAWLYKYRDKEPMYGDAWYKHYDNLVRKSKQVTDRSKLKQGFKVNFNKRSLNDKSWR